MDDQDNRTSNMLQRKGKSSFISKMASKIAESLNGNKISSQAYMPGQKNTDVDEDMEMIRSLKSMSKSEMRRA